MLLREVLRDVMSQATVEVLLHGMLLPALHMQVIVLLFGVSSETFDGFAWWLHITSRSGNFSSDFNNSS
jgi:hypothetical protein